MDKDVRMSRILKYLGLLLIVSSLIMLFGYIAIWFSHGMTEPVGQNMVDKEIIIIPKTVTLKPITLIIVLCLTGYLFVFESISNPLKKISPSTLRIIEIIAFIALIISVYELIFNFMIWGSMITATYVVEGNMTRPNIDLLYTSFPYSKYKWNLVFATKIFYMITFMAIITIYFTLYNWITGHREDAS